MNGEPIFSTIRDLPPPISSLGPVPSVSAYTNLANPLNLSFFGTSGFYSNLSSDWDRIERQVSENASGTISSAIPTTSVPEATSGLITELPAEETGLVEAGEIGAESSTPIGLALMVNQQLGSAVNQAMTSASSTQSNQDFVSNMQQHGLNVGIDAQLIRANQENTINRQDVGGSIGSLFGPLGALIGHSIAGVVSANPNLFYNSGSFSGAVNSSDLDIVASQSTQQVSGQSNLVDNVTGNDN